MEEEVRVQAAGGPACLNSSQALPCHWPKVICPGKRSASQPCVPTLPALSWEPGEAEGQRSWREQTTW